MHFETDIEFVNRLRCSDNITKEEIDELLNRLEAMSNVLELLYDEVGNDSILRLLEDVRKK